jgi:hypothetical protein
MGSPMKIWGYHISCVSLGKYWWLFILDVASCRNTSNMLLFNWYIYIFFNSENKIEDCIIDIKIIEI